MSAPTFLAHMKFYPQVDESRCVRCGACFEVCGTGAIEEGHSRLPKTAAGRCRNCRKCTQRCPNGALLVKSWFDGSGSAVPDARRGE